VVEFVVFVLGDGVAWRFLRGMYGLFLLEPDRPTVLWYGDGWRSIIII
jgi:hypothetical protein